jgi:hypothetical protein
MVRTEHYGNLDVDLGRLATRVQTYLQENKFEVAFSKDSTEPTYGSLFKLENLMLYELLQEQEEVLTSR